LSLSSSWICPRISPPGLVTQLRRERDVATALFRSELDLAALQRQELASIVELYRALGGGWSE
jgi:outer membrane protein TolC